MENLLDIHAALFPELDDIVEAVVVADDEVVLVRICRRERTEISRQLEIQGIFCSGFYLIIEDPRFGSVDAEVNIKGQLVCIAAVEKMYLISLGKLLDAFQSIVTDVFKIH